MCFNRSYLSRKADRRGGYCVLEGTGLLLKRAREGESWSQLAKEAKINLM